MPLADGPTVRGECGKIGWDLVLPGFLSILDKLGDLVQAAGRKDDLAFRKENVLPPGSIKLDCPEQVVPASCPDCPSLGLALLDEF